MIEMKERDEGMWGPFNDAKWSEWVKEESLVTIFNEEGHVINGRAISTDGDCGVLVKTSDDKWWSARKDSIIAVHKGAVDLCDLARVELMAERFAADRKMRNELAADQDIELRAENIQVVAANIERNAMMDTYDVIIRGVTRGMEGVNQSERWVLTTKGWITRGQVTNIPNVIRIPRELFRFDEWDDRAKDLDRTAKEASRSRDDALRMVRIHEAKDALIKLAMEKEMRRHDPKHIVPHLPWAGTCEQTQKREYLSRKDAKQAIRKMMAEGDTPRNDLSTYLCEHCGYHHIGSKRLGPEITPREVHRSIPR